MAINMQKLAISGGIAGAVTPFLLKYVVMPILNFLGGIVPSLGIKLASPGAIEVNIRNSLTGIPESLATWLVNALGLTIPESFMTTVLVSAVGGALFFVAGGYAADAIGILKGNAKRMTTITIFTGSVIVALIIGTIAIPPAIGLTLVNVLIAFMVNAAILSWLYTLIDEKGDIGLVPY